MSATVVALLAGLMATSPALAGVSGASAGSTKAAPAVSSTSEGLPSHHADPANPRVALSLAHTAAAGQVATWATQHHLSVVGTHNQITTVSGSRATVDAAFGTATAPAVPSDLAGVVTGAASDVSTLKMRPLDQANRPMDGLGSTPAATWPGGYGSAKLRGAYDVSGTGSGLTVASVQFDGWDSADFTNYASAAGITLSPGQMTAISVDGASVSGSEQEDSLDAETLLAMAPSAKQLMYIAPNTTDGLFDVYAQIAADVSSRHIAAVSVSWGFCEANFDSPGGPEARATVEASLHAIVAAGATVFASSGDDGPYDCGDGTTLSTDWPAVSPNAVGVGGTTLTGSGPYAETAWEDPDGTCNGSPVGGGGGTSTSVPRPSWQSGVGLSGSYRLVPDISAEADPCAPGPTVLLDGDWYYGGGTSLATPIVAGGLISELSNSCRTVGVGDIHPLLYSSAASDFRDVTSGSFPPYSAGVGYDELTGRGSPQMDGVAAGLPSVVVVPCAPTNVAASAAPESATVTWHAPNNGGSPITSYHVTASPGGKTCSTSGALTCVVTGLTDGTSYTFTVTATNAKGAGAVSSPSAAVTPVAPPGAPQSVVAVAANDALSVTWASPTSNGGSPITRYTATATPNGATCTWTSGPLGCVITGLTNGTSYTVKVTATNAQGTGPASAASAPATPNGGDAFHALTPARVLDSRPGSGNVGGYTSPWGAGVTRNVTVGGVGGVPSSADAVVLNVTETGATGSSFLSIWPAGASRPTVSSLNFTAGETIPNQVTVKLGSSGQVSIYNNTGSADVIVDVTGYYDTNTGDGFTSITPARLLDSRPGAGNVGGYATPWGAGVSRDLQVGGVGGVPSDADAVVLNVTVTDTTGGSYLAIWPQGASRPTVSSLNWTAGETIPNAVTVKLNSANGKVSLYNLSGNADVIVDVAGYFKASTGKLFHPLSPARILDSRPGTGNVGGYSSPWGEGVSRNLAVGGAGGVLSGADSVVANVTVTDTSSSSFLSLWPQGATRPTVSSLNWTAGETIPNAATVKLSTGGGLSIFNAGGSVDVICDVAGYYA